MSNTRIYKVTETVIDTDSVPYTSVRLVAAPNAAQAIRHVVKGSIVCEVCSVADAIGLGQAGYKVEKSGEEA